MTSRVLLCSALVVSILSVVGAGGLLLRRSLGEDKGAEPAPKFSAEQVSFYEKEVLPVLKQHCLKCHGEDPEKIKGGLDLTTRRAVLEGGDTGPAASATKPADSLLLKAVHYKDEAYQMPPKGKMPDKDIATLEKWVKGGLPVPADRLGDTAKAAPKGVVTEEARKYWAYQPVKRPAVPEVKNGAWAKSPIDAFVLAKLEAKGLKPVAPADKAALIRRATYDLTGLPPTPEEIDAFAARTDPGAYEELLDRLLASPQYGEKWGRHWLDVVRYGETNGYERDGPKPFAWRYRDYVIRSFNADKPYTQFVREQLAGDEAAGHDPDAVIATGFYRLGVWDDEPADPQLAVFDGYDDIVATVGQGLLGTTFNCARCHDHKADPIPAADYYKLVAFVRDVRPFSDSMETRSPFNVTDISPPAERAKYEEEVKTHLARLVAIRQAMIAIEDEVIKTLPAEDQRAAEGTGRPRVVSNKVVPALRGRQKDDCTALKSTGVHPVYLLLTG